MDRFYNIAARIFFEGTYTGAFSGNPKPSPGYDYNQIMYKLDLTDVRLNLPVPTFYRCGNGHKPTYLPQGTGALAGHEKQLLAVGYVWRK